MMKRLLVGCMTIAVVGTVVQVSPVSATAAKPTVTVKITGCDIPEEEAEDDLEFEYLADQTVGSCKLTATVKPRSPKRTVVLQRWDDESETWKDLSKKVTNSKGVTSMEVPDTFAKECLSYDSFKFRVISRKSGKNKAITGKEFVIAFLSDPESEPCLESLGEDDPSDKADDDFSVDY